MMISERKLDYLFNNNITPDAHNTPRAIQNAQQMQRLGFYNILSARDFVREHLRQVIQNSNNVVEQFTRTFVDKDGNSGEFKIEIPESILCGKSGKFYQMENVYL